MRVLMLIVSFFMLTNCNNYDFKLSKLKQEKLNFVNLPQAVKSFILNPPEFDNNNPSSLVFITSSEAERYKLEVVKTKVGSWIDYLKLVDVNNKISYKIEQGTPNPFFIYENKLYIPDKFNILNTVDDVRKVEFTCYILK